MAAPNQQAANKQFEFDALRHAVNYRAALAREFEPHLSGTVLELGAGAGQMTAVIRSLERVMKLYAVEPEPALAHQLRSAVTNVETFEGVLADIPRDWRIDAIVSVNVFEHIQNDSDELEKCHHLLAPTQGRLCLFVPARPEIFAPIDRDFGHFRRYRKAELREKLERAGFKIIRLRYYNFIGYFLWWAGFRLLKRRHFSPEAVRAFDRWIFPPVNFLETRLLPPPIGQSLLAVAIPA